MVTRVYSQSVDFQDLREPSYGCDRCTQFWLLLKKNIKLLTRQKLKFFISLIVGVVVFVIIVLTRAEIKPKKYENPTKFKEINIDNIWPMIDKNSYDVKVLAFCPESKIIENVIKKAGEKLKLDVISSPAEKLLQKEIFRNKTIVGVIFDESFGKITKLPRKVKFKLKFYSKAISHASFYVKNWRTDEDYMPEYDVEPVDALTQDIAPYFRSNFIAIQHAVTTSYIEALGPEDMQIPKVVMQQFTYPPYHRDEIGKKLTHFYLLVMILFAFPSAHIASILSYEKRLQFRTVTSVMGVSNWIHWLAWYVCSFLYLMVFAIGLILVLRLPITGDRILYAASDFLLVIFFVIYITSAITFTFMMSAGFSRKNIGYLMNLIIWIQMSTTTYVILDRHPKHELVEVIISNLYMNLALGLAFKEAIYLSNVGPGVTWSNIWIEQSLYVHSCFGYVLIFMICSAIGYFLIALLIQKLSPGKENIKEGWSISNFYEKLKGRHKNTTDTIANDSENYQTVFDDGKMIGVQLQDLHKTFGSYVAVNKLSINMYKDELTFILTDRGGGKTSTIALMTGILTPTSGNVFINGENIQTNWRMATKQIGYCPSFNYFFDELTAIETMMLLSRLKGRKYNMMKEIIKYTNILGFGPHLFSNVGNLSNINKMKLAMCTAFCGGSKVIICDETDLSLDPMSSEGVWNLLQKEKYGKTIIVFTSNFASMDFFADRIGIMFRGTLRGYGDIDFLRKRLNGGYMLKVIKSNQDFSNQEVTKFLSEFDPHVLVEEITDSYVLYVLSESSGELLAKILQKLNDSLNKLKISHYDLHLKPLEDLVLCSVKDRLDPNVKLYTGDKLRLRQWRALIYKKFVFNAIYIKRFVALVFSIAIILALFTYYDHEYLSYNPEYEIGFKTLKGQGFLEFSGNYEENNINSKLAREYRVLLRDIDLTVADNFESITLDHDEDRFNFHKSYLIAATINEEVIKVWFNNFMYHTPPLALNVIHNAIVRAMVGNDSSIEVVNAPAPLTYYDLIKIEKDWIFSMYHFCVFGMAFVTPLFLYDLVKERTYRYKAYLLHSGISSFTYWSSCYIWDSFVFVIISVALVLLMGCGEMATSYVLAKLGMYLMVFIFFGFCAIPMAYLIFQIVDARSSKLYVYVVLFNIITGFGFSILILLLRQNGSAGAEVASWFFKIFPHYNLGECMRKIQQVYTVQHYCEMICIDLDICGKKQICKEAPECCSMNIFEFGNYGINWELLYFFFFMIPCLFLVILFEFVGTCSRTKVPKKKSQYKQNFGDESTQQEKFRILSLTEDELEEHPLVMDRVSKYYGDMQALHQITFGIREGELLGLVGTVGSGKSTIFKIINGQENVTTGDVYLWGSKIESFTAYGTDIGHSPQNIGLPEYLSGRDAIQISGLIHGLHDKDIENICNDTAKYLGFTSSLNKDISTYDVNVKRKLMLAMAVIGNTSLILLDQPTESCAPAVRMRIWDFIVHLNQTGKTILFSSESIFECLQICTRIVVISNGEILSIGTPEDFKKNFQVGIDVTVKINEGNRFFKVDNKIARITRVTRLIERAYPEAVLRFKHYGMIMYFLPSKTTSDWLDLVSLLEKNKEAYKITSYYLTKTNIDVRLAEIANKQKLASYLETYYV